MQVRLKVMDGAHAGKEIVVKDEKFFIGRSESCQLRPKSESISRKHCAIVQKDGRVLVADLKSRNGTYINGVLLEPERAKIVKAGDLLKVGQLEFQLLIEVGLGGAKRPEVHSVQEAISRVAESGLTSKTVDSGTGVLDIDSWLSEPDQFDRSASRTVEPDTQLVVSNLDDTSRINLASEESEVSEPSSKDDSADSAAGPIRRADKKGPMKLPKHHQALSSKNSTDAASDALKKYFGGR
jgi:pSer/pThr/pTyr-binding forkhead associated (FHA) protein